jgi:hypothetical protein
MLNFKPWNQLLQAYVNDRGQVDYRRWQQEAEGALSDWLKSLRPIDLEQLTPDARLALLINLYNALTIQQVLTAYPIGSVCPTVLGIPNWLAFWRFFSRPIFELNGKPLSLNAIEHGMLRKQFKEPRIHFALVCASMGCPVLRNEAYLPDIVEAQLETDANNFIHNTDKVLFDPDSGILYCSKIFKWYEQDFLQVAASIPAYIGQYLTEYPEVSQALAIQYLPYSWGLNQQEYRGP